MCLVAYAVASMIVLQDNRIFLDNFKAYTGRNGWEEVAQAMDLASHVHIHYRMPPSAQKIISATDPVIQKLTNGLNKVQRDKAHYEHLSVDRFPTFQPIASSLSHRADALYQKGRSQEAAASTLAIFHLSEAIRRDQSFALLEESQMLEIAGHSDTSKHLLQLGRGDVRVYRLISEARVAQNLLLNALRAEEKQALSRIPTLTTKAIETLKKEGLSAFEGSGHNSKDWPAEMPLLSHLHKNPTSAEQVNTEAARVIKQWTEELEAIFQLPIKEQFRSIEDWSQAQKTDRPAEILAHLAAGFGPTIRRAVKVNAVNSVQWHLTRVHMAILEYRQKHGGFPAMLSQTGLSKTELTDPLSGQPFQYIPQSSGYELFSNGNSKTGRIDLDFKYDPYFRAD